jgi:hypothetical protein
MSSAVIKKNRATQRLWGVITSGTAAADLTGKTLDVVLANADESNPQTLAATIILPQTGGDMGRYSIDITSAQLALLGTPAQVLLVATVWNADTSRMASARGLLSVVL